MTKILVQRLENRTRKTAKRELIYLRKSHHHGTSHFPPNGVMFCRRGEDHRSTLIYRPLNRDRKDHPGYYRYLLFASVQSSQLLNISTFYGRLQDCNASPSHETSALRSNDAPQHGQGSRLELLDRFRLDDQTGSKSFIVRVVH